MFKTLTRKAIKILLTMPYTERTYASNLSKKTQITYSHTVKLLNVCEDEGLTKNEKVGRTKYVELTEKGRRVQDHLMKIKEILKK